MLFSKISNLIPNVNKFWGLLKNFTFCEKFFFKMLMIENCYYWLFMWNNTYQWHLGNELQPIIWIVHILFQIESMFWIYKLYFLVVGSQVRQLKNIYGLVLDFKLWYFSNSVQIDWFWRFYRLNFIRKNVHIMVSDLSLT